MAYSLNQLIARDWGEAGHADPVKFEIKCVEKVCCEQISHGKNPCDDGKPFILTKVRWSTDFIGLGGRIETELMEFFQSGTSNGSPKYSYNNDEFLKANGKTLDDCDFECEYFLDFCHQWR